MDFQLVSKYPPTGDQPQAIEELTAGLDAGDPYQVLLGVTGSGKTFTLANVIARVNRPTLILSHNKTLAAQLYGEFKSYFPENAVGYFVSYYDYYQPEAYVPQTDTYIEKDASINENIDRLRLEATANLLTRRDVIIVASVSCIYGLGRAGGLPAADAAARRWGSSSPARRSWRSSSRSSTSATTSSSSAASSACAGDVIDVFPSHAEEAFRIELFGDEVERITRPRPRDHAGEAGAGGDGGLSHHALLHPARSGSIGALDGHRGGAGGAAGRAGGAEQAPRGAAAQDADEVRPRDAARDRLLPGDRELLPPPRRARCPGSGRRCLLDYFPKDFLMVLDESHVTVPQVGGMYEGDRSRKQTLVDFGFRLPSALDNRPLRFEEFEQMVGQVIFVSATPADFELEKTGGVVVEQVIRPTGLVDPEIVVRPTENQIDDLLEEIRLRVARQERVLVTTLTKRMAEDLTDYLVEAGVRVRYIHSDVDAIERMEILRGLRLGKFDVLVGINLLREGLDLPGGLAGGDPRRRQGGVPAQRA